MKKSIGAKGRPGYLKVKTPRPPFLYTVDQIAWMLNVQPKTVLSSHLYFEGRSTGVIDKNLMHAINIAPSDQSPDWRVMDSELRRWMRQKGYKTY